LTVSTRENGSDCQHEIEEISQKWRFVNANADCPGIFIVPSGQNLDFMVDLSIIREKEANGELFYYF